MREVCKVSDLRSKLRGTQFPNRTTSNVLQIHKGYEEHNDSCNDSQNNKYFKLNFRSNSSLPIRSYHLIKDLSNKLGRS